MKGEPWRWRLSSTTFLRSRIAHYARVAVVVGAILVVAAVGCGLAAAIVLERFVIGLLKNWPPTGKK